MEQQAPGLYDCPIDSTGDPDHDFIRACPMGIQLREAVAAREVSLFQKIELLGGAAQWYPEKLSLLDTVTTDRYQLLKAVKSRFVAEMHRVRSEMDRPREGAQ